MGFGASATLGSDGSAYPSDIVRLGVAVLDNCIRNTVGLVNFYFYFSFLFFSVFCLFLSRDLSPSTLLVLADLVRKVHRYRGQ